jgi:hypothetical protein
MKTEVTQELNELCSIKKLIIDETEKYYRL